MNLPPPPPTAPPPPAGYQYGQGLPARNDGRAVAALVCGIVGLLFGGFILGVIAIVLGVMGRNAIRSSGGTLKGAGMATAGIVLGIFDIFAGVFVFIWLVGGRW